MSAVNAVAVRPTMSPDNLTALPAHARTKALVDIYIRLREELEHRLKRFPNERERFALAIEVLTARQWPGFDGALRSERFEDCGK